MVLEVMFTQKVFFFLYIYDGQASHKVSHSLPLWQAKERELELKNTWAENRLTRRQTQAKYGF